MRTSFLLELDEAVLMGATMASEWNMRAACRANDLGASVLKRPSLGEAPMADEDFSLGEPALVCRWRLAGRHVPMLNRHMRALSQRHLQDGSISANMLSWVKQHIEWALAEDTTAVADGVLMLVIDEAGQAVMSTGAYVPLADATADVLMVRAANARVEADRTGIAPEVLCSMANGVLTVGISSEANPCAAVSLAEQLAQTRGVRVERDPALSYRVVGGLDAGAVALLSDEHGAVASIDRVGTAADEELIAFLVSAFDKLRDSARR